MLNITENKLRIEIAAEQLCPSEHNHFRVEMDEAMEELIASIQLKGILVPLIVREVSSERYEILSGHRRHFAALKAGLDKIPVTILNVSDEDRDIIIADSNLQRPYIRTSEKAWAIRLKYDAFKRKSNGKFIESRTWDRGPQRKKCRIHS